MGILPIFKCIDGLGILSMKLINFSYHIIGFGRSLNKNFLFWGWNLLKVLALRHQCRQYRNFNCYFIFSTENNILCSLQRSGIPSIKEPHKQLISKICIQICPIILLTLLLHLEQTSLILTGSFSCYHLLFFHIRCINLNKY
jgi:hypothetical protein